MPRPSRILAIAGDKVKLKCDWSNSSELKYLALSHMWGTDSTQQFRFFMSLLDEFHQEIPWAQLSFISKEAITIARQIDYRYIA
jgi:hypothetical protein